MLYHANSVVDCEMDIGKTEKNKMKEKVNKGWFFQMGGILSVFFVQLWVQQRPSTSGMALPDGRDHLHTHAMLFSPVVSPHVATKADVIISYPWSFLLACLLSMGALYS